MSHCAIVSVAGVIVAGAALIQLLEIPFRATVGNAIFRLAVVDADGHGHRGCTCWGDGG